MKIFYVYSGKGGVGKSSVCLNLAFQLNKQGHKVAVFDSDISGPSMPVLVKGLEFTEQPMKGVSIQPRFYKGVKISSIGFNNDVLDSSFWSGKYLKGVFHQFLYSVKFDVDILLIDLPPGTSEVHKELFSNLADGKVVVVTTPQIVSHADVLRSIDFIKRLNIEILGVVENMAYYICEKCSTKIKIFHGDTKTELCEKHDLLFLGELPIVPEMNKFANDGIPYLLSHSLTEYESLSNNILSLYETKKTISKFN